MQNFLISLLVEVPSKVGKVRYAAIIHFSIIYHGFIYTMMFCLCCVTSLFYIGYTHIFMDVMVLSHTPELTFLALKTRPEAKCIRLLVNQKMQDWLELLLKRVPVHLVLTRLLYKLSHRRRSKFRIKLPFKISQYCQDR